jgi:hypothetical protein
VPAGIEVSADGGTTFAPLQRGPALGDLLATIPAPAAGQHLAVRLSAEDQAGNKTLAPPIQLDAAAPAAGAAPVAAVVPAAPTAPVVAPAPAPAPAAPPPAVPMDDASFAAALAALPTVTPDPVVPAARPAAPPAAMPGPLVPAVAPPVAVARPEIVEPNRPIPPPVETGDPTVEVVSGPGLDAEYQRARAAKAGTDKAPAWQETKERPSRLATESEAPAAPPRPAIPAPPAGLPPAGSLTPAQAQNLLAQARAAAQAGDDVTALAYYRRLQGSPLAAAATLDEVRLLRLRNRTAEGLAAIAALPAARLDDSLRIEQGRLLIAAGRPREALPPLTAVRSGSGQSDEALFVVAQALAADGKADQAKKVYAAVAKGSGPWAQAAQQQLGR